MRTLVGLLLLVGGVGTLTAQGPLPSSLGGGGGGSSSGSSGLFYCAPASASGTTYTCAPSPALTAYASGVTLNFLPDVTVTPGAVTVKVNSLGAKSIKEADGSTNPLATDLVAGRLSLLSYDGTVFRIIGTDGTGPSEWTACSSGCTTTIGASPISITAGTSVTATTHGQGVNAMMACFTSATPAVAADCTYSRAANGDVVISYTIAPGYIQIYSPFGSAGAAGPAGPAGPSSLGTPIEITSTPGTPLASGDNLVPHQLNCTAACTISAPAVISTVDANWQVPFYNIRNSATVFTTLSGNGNNINGAATVTLLNWDGVGDYPSCVLGVNVAQTAYTLRGTCVPTTHTQTNVTPVTANANSTSAQQLQEIAIPAGYLNSLGLGVSFHSSGIFSTTLTPTVTLTMRLCTVSGCGSGTVVPLVVITSTATVTGTNNQFSVNFSCGVTAVGASGNLICHGLGAIDLTAASVTSTVFSDANTAVSSNINLAAALFFDTFVTFSSGSASNIMTNQLSIVVSL